MAVNCFMCCLTSLQRAGSVRRSASRNFGVRASTASVQNFDESASRSASPPRAAASTSLRAALASGVPLAGGEYLLRLVLCGGGVLGGLGVTRRGGGVIGDATGRRGLQPRRGGGVIGGTMGPRRRVRVRGGVGIGGSAILTKVFGWGCILALLGWGAAASMASWGARASFCRLCCDLVNLCARYEMTQLRARTRDLRRRAGPECIRASHVMFYSIVREKRPIAMHSSVLHR